MTDQERLDALEKQVNDLAHRIVWAKEQTYNLQNNLTERMGTTLYDQFNIADEVSGILRYLEPIIITKATQP